MVAYHGLYTREIVRVCGSVVQRFNGEGIWRGGGVPIYG